jgi:hypothetical protein
MIKRPRFDGLWIAGIVFGLVMPLPFALIYSALAGYFFVPGLFAAGPTLQEKLLAALILLWPSAGWMGLASLFSILKRSDYSSRALSLWQISGLITGIVAASPWIITGSEAVALNQAGGLYYLFLFCLAGPIVVAVVCLVKLKWKIRKNKTETSQPASSNGA